MSDQHSRLSRSSIEDNYPEYLEQQFGYAYEVDDVMSQAAIARHQQLLHADQTELEAVELDAVDDFQKWAVARAWRRRGDFDRFVEVCRRLLRSDQEHPVVIYSEISRGLADALISEERFEEADDLIDAHLERWPEDVQARQLGAILEFLGEEADDSGLDELCDQYPADAELRFEIAEDLWRFGKADAATRWLDKARQAARDYGERAALVDIELLAERIRHGSESARRPDAEQ